VLEQKTKSGHANCAIHKQCFVHCFSAIKKQQVSKLYLQKSIFTSTQTHQTDLFDYGILAGVDGDQKVSSYSNSAIGDRRRSVSLSLGDLYSAERVFQFQQIGSGRWLRERLIVTIKI
jgi:hypothetical protein